MKCLTIPNGKPDWECLFTKNESLSRISLKSFFDPKTKDDSKGENEGEPTLRGGTCSGSTGR